MPWAAGGATDISMRVLADPAGRHLRQKVVVDNKPGAGGSMIMPILQQAEPDGGTIARRSRSRCCACPTQKVLWDPVRDVTPIIQISGVTFGVLVLGTSRFRTLEDLFAFARERPGELEHRHQRRRHHAARGAGRAVQRRAA